MSAEAAFCVRSWTAGQYTCTLTMCRPKPRAVVHVTVDWQPHLPTRLSEVEIVEYRAGRDKALAEISLELGLNAAVLEL